LAIRDGSFRRLGDDSSAFFAYECLASEKSTWCFECPRFVQRTGHSFRPFSIEKVPTSTVDRDSGCPFDFDFV